MNNEPTLRQLTNEDLQLDLDRALEQGNNRRENSILSEMRRRQEEDSIEL